MDLRSESGFTVIEVLISSIIFIVGFSLLVALTGNVSSKFSTEEVVNADHLGHEMMLTTISSVDTTYLDSVITYSNMKLHVLRNVVVDGDLVQVRIKVIRSNKELTDLYDEFQITR